MPSFKCWRLLLMSRPFTLKPCFSCVRCCLTVLWRHITSIKWRVIWPSYVTTWQHTLCIISKARNEIQHYTNSRRLIVNYLQVTLVSDLVCPVPIRTVDRLGLNLSIKRAYQNAHPADRLIYMISLIVPIQLITCCARGITHLVGPGPVSIREYTSIRKPVYALG